MMTKDALMRAALKIKKYCTDRNDCFGRSECPFVSGWPYCKVGEPCE